MAERTGYRSKLLLYSFVEENTFGAFFYVIHDAEPLLLRKRSSSHPGVQLFKKHTQMDMFFEWRREQDSNLRYHRWHTRFPSVRLQPLGHLSITTDFNRNWRYHDSCMRLTLLLPYSTTSSSRARRSIRSFVAASSLRVSSTKCAGALSV